MSAQPPPKKCGSQPSMRPIPGSSNTKPALEKRRTDDSDKAPSKPSSIKSDTRSGRNTPDLDKEQKCHSRANEAITGTMWAVEYQQAMDIFSLNKKAIIAVREAENTVNSLINTLKEDTALNINFPSSKSPNSPIIERHPRWKKLDDLPDFEKFKDNLEDAGRLQLLELVKNEVIFLRNREMHLIRLSDERTKVKKAKGSLEPFNFTIGTRPVESAILPMDEKLNKTASKKTDA